MRSQSGNPSRDPSLTSQGYPRWLDPALRWALLLGVGLWLALPLMTSRNIGTGDALWNAQHIADAMEQFRSGVFPLYVGQGVHQFNGSIYPFRVAPYYLYLGGLLDALTGHQQSPVLIEHLTAAVSLVAGLVSSYLCLTWLRPGRRWMALLISILYGTCPGVIGLVYAQDLYMSTMTIPWVPVALAGIYRCYENPSRSALVVSAIGLSALYWAHSPIAFWVGIAGAGLLVPLVPRLVPQTRLWLPGLAVAVLLGAYPIVSSALIRSPGEKLVPYQMDREQLLKEVSDSFPANVLPLNADAPLLTHLQIGYGLCACLALALGLGLLGKRPKALLLSVGLVAFLCALIYPVPGVTRALWMHLPESVVGLTLYWPMQRISIVIAAVCALGSFTALAGEERSPKVQRFALGALVLGVLWSLGQTQAEFSRVRHAGISEEDTAIVMRPENAPIQRHSYHLFETIPAYFNNGFMDPMMESRLLRLDGSVLASNTDGLRSPDQTFTGTIDANPGILDLEPKLTLEPGVHYALTFSFLAHDYTGILQVVGPHTFREYSLPDSGKTLAFGTGPNQSKTLTFWTTASEPETIQLRFIPTAAGATPSQFVPFARYSLQAIDAERLPVTLTSLIPYRARVRAPQPCILETPRLVVPGYQASVNGQPVPVLRSAQSFVSLRVPAGESQVQVAFKPPFLLGATFWVALVGWLAVAGVALRQVILSIKGRSPEASS